MVAKAVIVGLTLLALAERCLALSCRPCNPNGCGQPPTCSYGVTRGVCSCCYDTCGKGPGEECGGDWGFTGTCGDGLECEVVKQDLICKDDVCWYPAGYNIGTCVARDVKCPSPWFRVGNECFLRVEPDLEYLNGSWSSARSYCREQAPRADLAQPNNIKGLADYLVDNGYDRRYQHYWIGGSDIVTEGEWLWLNGSVVTNTTHYRGFEITEWNNGDGGADCLTMWIGEGSDSVDLYDWECDEGFFFICERY